MKKGKTKFKVVLFEDNEDTASAITQYFANKVMNRSIEIERYTSGKGSVEDFLLKDESIGLVILDWLLDLYKPAVSRHTVEGVCDEEGIPICIYHYGATMEDKLKRMMKWGENKIWLQDFKTLEELEPTLYGIISGFYLIRTSLSGILNSRFSLGNLINKILQTPPEARITIDQYLWSRFRAFQVLESADQKSVRLMSSLIGYWIYNVLLQFPGPIVSEGAAASFLDISEEDFSRVEIRNIFKDALYKGPFNNTDQYWWTRKIDNILAASILAEDKEIPSGNILATRTGFEVKHSRCYTGHDGAGYFCIIRRTPVCAVHSLNPGGWIPSGADLSRIEKTKYNELSAWMDL
jgi:hypothetical protein